MSLLILTVGTGTAGAHSNLSQGLINTIREFKPRAYWLVPSQSPDSLANADLIAGECPGHQPWSDTQLYIPIPEPDDLESCRSTLRQVISTANRQRRSGEPLCLNPTSGTKQMSVGATLAALDLQLAHIQFTVGQRQDGVVRTGSERLQTFDPAAYFRERDLAAAAHLFQAGANFAAAHLLQPHPQYTAQRALALCLDRWCHLDYREAARHAAACSEPLRIHLLALARCAENAQLHPLLLADLLQGAEHWRELGEPDRTIAQLYKALEYATRLRLQQTCHLTPPYRLDQMLQLPLPREIHNRLEAIAVDGICRPGLRHIATLLQATGDPFASDYLSDRPLQKLVELRNQLTHEIRPGTPDEAESMLDRTRNLFRAHLQLPDVPPRPRTL